MVAGAWYMTVNPSEKALISSPMRTSHTITSRSMRETVSMRGPMAWNRLNRRLTLRTMITTAIPSKGCDPPVTTDACTHIIHLCRD